LKDKDLMIKHCPIATITSTDGSVGRMSGWNPALSTHAQTVKEPVDEREAIGEMATQTPTK